MSKNKYSAIYLVAIITLIFLIQKLLPAFTEIFKLTSSQVLVSPYTLLTSIFLHGSIIHLLYNMFALALFGTILEHNIGTKKFLYLFFLAGLFASIVSVPFYHSVLGASGAIFGIIGALSIIKPKMVIWVYGMPMPMFLAAIIYALIDLIGVFAPSDTANIAHLFGLFIGVIFGFYLRQKLKNKNAEIEKQ